MKFGQFRIYMVNIILPLLILAGVFQAAMVIWFLEGEVEDGGLECRRFLHEPLIELFSGKPDAKKDLPDWVVFVVMEDGRVLYPIIQQHPDLLKFLDSQRQQMDIYRWSSAFAQVIPDNLTVVHFYKDGVKGVFMNKADLLPIQLRVYQNPPHMTFVFIIALAFFSSGVVAMNRHNRNIDKLVQAARNITRMELDKPVGSFSKVNEMAAVFEAFEEMRLEIKETRRKGSFLLSSVTHDMKTPLTSMRVYLEALKDGVIESHEEATAAVDKILSKAGMLEDRINEMIYMFKSFSQGMSNEDGNSIDSRSWLGELSELFREESALNGRRYEERFDMEAFPQLKGNASMLTRAVHNLLDNACRYTAPDDLIRFSAGYRRSDASLLLKMEDSGPGVKPEDREKIFDLFYRSDQGRNSRGMGIGLASIKFLMEEFGGDISYEDSELGGACFVLRLAVAPVTSES